MTDGLEWLPEDGAALSRADLERIFIALRALVANTDPLEPNRSHAIEIAVTVSDAIERSQRGES